MTTDILLIIVAAALALSIYFNVKFALVILRAEDAIEAALDDLDGRYQAMSEILQRPVFFDSIEVRQVIAEIGACRDVILKVANRLTSVGVANERSSD